MDDAGLKRLAEAATHVRLGTCGTPEATINGFHNAANPDTILRLLRERDELAVELMDNSISAAAVAIQLRRERDEARAAIKRVETECGRLMGETRDDESEHGLATGSAAGRVIMAIRAPYLLDADQGAGEGT